MTMDLNSTINVTADGVTAIHYKVISNAILLLTVLSVIVFDLLVIAALIANSETVRSIHWILGNILIACVVGALVLVGDSTCGQGAGDTGMLGASLT